MASGLSYAASTPFVDGNYFWHVRAYNLSNQPGSWSSTRTFTIDTTGPLPPTLNSPADGSSTKRTPAFKWLKVTDAAAYEFQYDDDLDEDDSGFINPIYAVTIRGIFRRLPAMRPGTYYWHVRAKDAVGNWGDWSAPFTITILAP
jgi:hypothetical protein